MMAGRDKKKGYHTVYWYQVKKVGKGSAGSCILRLAVRQVIFTYVQ